MLTFNHGVAGSSPAGLTSLKVKLMGSSLRRMPRRFKRASALAFAALAVAALDSGPGRAEYPEQQITFIVCFPPGGGTDVAARIIDSYLSDALGKPVIVENRSGAGGNAGIVAAASAPADGYTLLVCSSRFLVNPSLQAQASYDPLKDFAPVMLIGVSPNVFVVPAHSSIASMPELIDKAKANPGKLSWTSSGVGTTSYLAGEVLKLRTGIDMPHTSFPGAGPLNSAVLSGQIDLYTATVDFVMPLINAGRVRPIAVTSSWADLPYVPSLDELGIKNADLDTFQGILAPAGTPQPVIDRLVTELSTILNRNDVREGFAKAGLPVTTVGPEAFRARIQRDLAMYRQIVEQAGLSLK
jgi:tripartite-type tricarboxylate transporter receptor subunit TctC